MTPMPKNSKPGGWIVLAAIGGLVTIYVLAVYLPIRKAIGRLKEETQQKREYCAQTGDLGPILDATRQKLESTLQYTRAWTETAPRGGQLSSLLGKINALGQAAGAHTTRFDPEPIVQHDRVASIPVTMGLTGTPSQVFEFLGSLERLPQSIWIENVTIEKEAETEKDGGSVTCKLSLEVFVDKAESSYQENLADQPITKETVPSGPAAGS